MSLLKRVFLHLGVVVPLTNGLCIVDYVCRFFFWNYTSVFTGSGMVDWLVEEGIVSNREEGAEYGYALMLGRVLSHVTEEHYFHDSGYFYQFSPP